MYDEVSPTLLRLIPLLLLQCENDRDNLQTSEEIELRH